MLEYLIKEFDGGTAPLRLQESLIEDCSAERACAVRVAALDILTLYYVLCTRACKKTRSYRTAVRRELDDRYRAAASV